MKMPESSSRKSSICLHRRCILKKGLALAAGVAALGPRPLFAGARDDAARWAFLSDTHIPSDPDRRCRGSYPYRNLHEIISCIASDLPDGLVFTGDLARSSGHIAAYDNLKTLLTPVTDKRTVCLGLGNHDDRHDFFRAFAETTTDPQPVKNRHIVTVNAGPVRFVVLDTLYVVNMMPGLLGRPQRLWLQTLLRACDDRPTILCLHHTPWIELLDNDRFFDIIAPMTKVKAVVYGHSHKYAFSQYKGIHLINLPATGYNFSSKQPVGWLDAHLTAKGACFTLNAIDGNRKQANRTHTIFWRA
jgi:3',5'-cyclic AMP phosphodiesterase CpdA